MTCPDCGKPTYRAGPFTLCRNVECDLLVVKGKLLTTPWSRKALGRDLMAELAALLPPDQALHVGAGYPGSWTARVIEVPSLRLLSETYHAPTAEAAARRAIAAARAAEAAA